MELSTDEKNDIVVISMKGKIMGVPGEQSLTDMICKYADEGKTRIVFDLSGVTWMNSAGLGKCIAALTILRNRGGDLKLAAPPKIVMSLMEQCRLHTIFRFYETVEKAVKDFG